MVAVGCWQLKVTSLPVPFAWAILKRGWTPTAGVKWPPLATALTAGTRAAPPAMLSNRNSPAPVRDSRRRTECANPRIGNSLASLTMLQIFFTIAERSVWAIEYANGHGSHRGPKGIDERCEGCQCLLPVS